MRDKIVFEITAEYFEDHIDEFISFEDGCLMVSYNPTVKDHVEDILNYHNVKYRFDDGDIDWEGLPYIQWQILES